MRYRKIALSSMLVTSSFMFTACGGLLLPALFGSKQKSQTSVEPQEFIYKGHSFGTGRNMEYQQGVKDGCTTAYGTYAKSHSSFNSSMDYRVGWEDGRLHCKGIQQRG